MGDRSPETDLNPAEQIVKLAQSLNALGIDPVGRKIRIFKDCKKYCFPHWSSKVVIGACIFGFEVAEISGEETVVYLGDERMPTYADVIVDIVLEELRRINPHDIDRGLRGRCRDRIAAEIATWFEVEEVAES